MRRPHRAHRAASTRQYAIPSALVTRFAAHAPIERRKLRQRDTENVKHCDQSVSQSQTHPSNSFIASRAGQDPLLAAYHATAPPKQAKKLHVLHQRHFWKATNVQEDSASAEYPVVPASDSRHNSGVTRKTVRQPIDVGSRQAYPEITSRDPRIVHEALDLSQTSVRDCGVDMDKPKDVTMRGTRADIHLYRSIALAYDNLIAKAGREISRAIVASTVGNYNLRFWRSVS